MWLRLCDITWELIEFVLIVFFNLNSIIALNNLKLKNLNTSK